ncbi:MAG: rhomboid family intramembrane serine protease [Actinomycetota bacterium]|nr:MAG: rhomboid family intramembrane serine protease [Actinomycetota bacterium]
MTQAAVGWHCPECVRAAAATVRAPQGRFGGRLATGTPVTLLLIAANVVIFVLTLVGGQAAANDAAGLHPYSVALLGEWWRLPASMFLHTGFLHILFNMYVLYLFGQPLERLFGSLRFAALYLLAGLGGAVASYWFSDPRTVSVGASGAIFGLMGALAVVGRRLQYDIGTVIAVIAINLVLGFIVTGIDWRAHLGGLVTGAVVAAVLAYAPRRGRLVVQWAGLAAILLALVAATALRTQDLRSPLGLAAVPQPVHSSSPAGDEMPAVSFSRVTAA